MTEREERVIKAMLDAVWRGDWTKEYVIIILEDDSKYGWMSQTAKDYFYDHVDDTPYIIKEVE